MKAWNLIAPKQLEMVTSQSAPVTNSELVKVKIEIGALSFTDVHSYNGNSSKFPIILGRHGVGVISEVYPSDDSFFIKSDRVVIDPVIPCGQCMECKTGHFKNCSNKKILGVNADGLQTDFITLPIDTVHKIPQNIPFETAVFTEYVALAVNALDKINIQKGDHVAILASNKIGYVIAQLVAYYQGIPVMIDNNEKALADARDVGVFYTFNSDKVDTIEEVFSITGGRMCDKVIYLTNTPKNINTALQLCAYNGIVCASGYEKPNQTADFSLICKKQLTVYTIDSGFGSFPTAINLLANKAVKVSGLICDTVSFESLDKAYELSQTSDLIFKSLLIDFK
ncbi:MAG: alcohol dehydrogenase catalytic domain-containing protein [Clostridia bacterium]